MSKGGRPRKYDPIADEISFAIEEMNNTKAQDLISQSSIDILDGEARTPLIYASFSGNIEMLKWLIDQGAEIDHQDRSGICSLHAASQNGHIRIIEKLLESGANPNLVDSFGNGPLWTATMKSKGDETITSTLIKGGADPHHKNNAGKSPSDMMDIISKNLKLMAEQEANDKA